MEQFLFIPATVYNKSFNDQSITKQKLSTYQLSQNPTNQIDSLKKEKNKNLLVKTGSLVDKILSCPRIKLSKSQSLKLDDVETGVLMPDFAQQFRCKNAYVPDLYYTLLEAVGISPTLVLNQNARAKERGSWAPSRK